MKCVILARFLERKLYLFTAAHKCALAYTYSAQPRFCDVDCIRGYDHTGKVREGIAICLHCQWAPFCDVSVTKALYVSIVKVLVMFTCIEYCRLVDTYYRQNKKPTVITLVWSVCSDWIAESGLDLEIMSLAENTGVCLAWYAIMLMYLFLVKRKRRKQFCSHSLICKI